MPTTSAAARASRHASLRAWALLLASGTLSTITLAPWPARADLDEACASLAELSLEEIAAADSDTVNGCDSVGADTAFACDFVGSGGPCSSNPVCSSVTVTEGESCTSSTLSSACCTEVKSIASSSTPATIGCITTCASSTSTSTSTPSTTPSTTTTTPSTVTPSGDYSYEVNDEVCAEVSELLLEALAEEDPELAAVSCVGADLATACDTLGSAGTCASNPSCDDVSTILGDACTSSSDDSGCCTVLLAKPCDSCDPIPGSCFQGCLSGSSSGGTPSTPTTPVSFTDPPPPPPPPAPVEPIDVPATESADPPAPVEPSDEVTTVGPAPPLDYEPSEPENDDTGSPRGLGDLVVGDGPSPIEEAVEADGASALMPLRGLWGACAAAAAAALCAML